MSIRYSLSLNATDLEKRFEVEVPMAYQPTFNAAPSKLLPVVTNTGAKGLSFFYWGIAPQWANNKAISEKIIQTREESIREKSILRKSLRQNRCIIPANGFYVWKKVGKKAQIPYFFTLRNKEAFSMAGLWEEYDDENGEFFHTFTMITTRSNTIVLPFTDRMPVILEKSIEKDWLTSAFDEEALLRWLTPYPSENLDFYSVSPRINSLTQDDALLIRPAPAADQFGNLTLFD